MPEKDYLETEEAVALFINAGLSESTFYRKARNGKIRKRLPVGRMRGAEYSRVDIENIIRIEGTNKTPEKEQSIGETDWITANDLPYVLALDYEMYGAENTVDISITHKWWEKNPYMCRILYNKEDRRDIWGAITIMPMAEATILRLLRHEIAEREITPDDILTYEPGEKYTVYIPSTVIRPQHRLHFRKLLNSMFNYWCDQYPDIQLNRLYAYAASDEGWELIRHLFFSPRYDIGEDVFELNLYQRNPSKMIQSFQECIKQKEEEKIRVATDALNVDNITSISKSKNLRFSRLTPEKIQDIEEEYQLAASLFGEAVHDIPTRLNWLKKNPYTDFVVKDEGKITGFINIMPVKHDTIMRFIEGEIRGWEIPTEDILPYKPGTEVECIFMAMVTAPHPSASKRKQYGATLINGLARFLQALAQKKITITKFYATSVTPTGIAILKHAGFKNIGQIGKRIAFELDTETSEVPIIKAYKNSLHQNK